MVRQKGRKAVFARNEVAPGGRGPWMARVYSPWGRHTSSQRNFSGQTLCCYDARILTRKTYTKRAILC